MKRIYAIGLFAAFFTVANIPLIHAQIQMDRDLQMNGTAGNRNITGAETVDVSIGYRYNGTAASGNYLRGNGTNYVPSAIQAGDIPGGSGNYIQNQTGANQSAGFRIQGIGNVNNGSPYAVANNNMASGSFTIGGTSANYGGGSSWNSNTAGLMLEAQDNFEIAMHDSGERIASLMYYQGGGTNHLNIGRDMGWGGIGRVNFVGNNYAFFGPNSTWGAYLQVGGNGRVTAEASVTTTNGNLHLDAKDGGFATYINYYSQNPTYINAQGGNVGIGNTGPGYKLHVSGDIYANGGWMRVSGNQGLYFESWGGGWFMQDGTWVRAYNGKSIWTSATVQADGSMQSPIYYDANNNGYYANPNGFSNFNQLNVSRDGASECCSGGNFTLSLAESTSGTGRTASLQFHNGGVSEGYMRLANGGNRRFEFNDFQNVGMSLNPRGHVYPQNNVTWNCGLSGLAWFDTYTDAVFRNYEFSLSDETMKTNIRPMDEALEKVMKLSPKVFDYNMEKMYGDGYKLREYIEIDGKNNLGFIAQELKEVYPELVKYHTEKQVYMVNYEGLIPVLVQAIQEQQKRIEQLEKKN